MPDRRSAVPTLIYDGDCAFCARCADWVRVRVCGRADVRAWQTLPDLAGYGLTEADVAAAAWWRDDDGRLHRGHESVARALVAVGGAWRPVGRLVAARPLRPLAAWGYAWVSRNRHRLPGGTAACAAGDGGGADDRPGATGGSG